MKVADITTWIEKTSEEADMLAASFSRDAIRFIEGGWETDRFHITETLRTSMLKNARIRAVKAYATNTIYQAFQDEAQWEAGDDMPGPDPERILSEEHERDLKALMDTDPSWIGEALVRSHLFVPREVEERPFVPAPSIPPALPITRASVRRLTREPCPGCKAEPQPYTWVTCTLPIGHAPIVRTPCTFYSYEHKPECSVSQLVAGGEYGGIFTCQRCRTWYHGADGIVGKSVECPFCWVDAKAVNVEGVAPILQALIRSRGLRCAPCLGTGIAAPFVDRRCTACFDTGSVYGDFCACAVGERMRLSEEGPS